MAPATVVLAARGSQCAAACGGRLHVGSVDTGLSRAVCAALWAPDSCSDADSELVAAAVEPKTIVVLRARCADTAETAGSVGYQRLCEL
jgi:hypothetical protein